MKIVGTWAAAIVASWLFVFGAVKAFSQEQRPSVALTIEQWNIVSMGLNELPRKFSNPVWIEIDRQLTTAAQKPKLDIKPTKEK